MARVASERPSGDSATMTAPSSETLKLVYCQQCRQPIGKAAPGSRVELPCRRCRGLKTYVEVK
jgi:hypothetical protein